jgi:hypothetical protein
MAVIVVVPREEIQGINDFFNTILMPFVAENFSESTGLGVFCMRS